MFYSLLMRSCVTIYNVSIVFIAFVLFSFIGGANAAPHEQLDKDSEQDADEKATEESNSYLDGKVLKLIHVVKIT